MTNLEIRAAATSATFDRFNGQPFVLGQTDCARMVAFHLQKLGFPASMLPHGGTYSTEVGARRALKRLGVTTLAEIMDKHFLRIAPAEALPGDVVCGPGVGDTGNAMAIRLHRSTALGFLDGVCGEVLIHEPIAAWRVV